MNIRSEKIFTLPFMMILFLSVLSGSAAFMVNPILPQYLVSKGAPMQITGIISSLMSLVALMGRPFSGAAGDRFNKKKLLVISYCLSIICLYLYSIADSVEMIIFVRILNGISFSLSGTVSMAFGAEFLPLSRLGEGLSYIGIGTVISTMIGPQLGDIIQSYYGMEAIFIWACFINMLCAFGTWLLPYKPQVKEKKEKFKFRLEDFFAFDLIIYVFLIGMLSIGNGILLYYLKDFGEKRNIANITLFYTVGSIATILSKPFTGKLLDRKAIAFTLYPAFVISALFAFIFARAESLPLILVAAVLKSVGQGSGQSAIQTETLRQLGIKKSGVASSTCYIGMDLGNVIGPAIGAFVISNSGYGTLFNIYGILLLLCIPIYYIYSLSKRRKGTI